MYFLLLGQFLTFVLDLQKKNVKSFLIFDSPAISNSYHLNVQFNYPKDLDSGEYPIQNTILFLAKLLFYGNFCLGPLRAWINYDTDEVPLLNIYSQVTNQKLSNNFELLFNSRVLLKLVHFPPKNHNLLLNDLYLTSISFFLFIRF